MTDQLSLFPAAPEATAFGAKADAAALDARFERLKEVAAKLPPTLRMGTSSWSFPGWRGIVYPSASSTHALAREGLRLYSRHPLLRTVGIDRSYYAPIPSEDLQRYADQLPDGFQGCAKAPVTVTAFTVPAPSGKVEPNPDFLSAPRFIEETLDPFERWFAKHAGPFILQFPPVPFRATLEPSTFAELLDRFFEQLPRWCEYAVEIRDRALLTDGYRSVLRRHGVAHVCSYWTAMPLPGEQAAFMAKDAEPGAGAGFDVIRLLLRPGTRYEERKQEMAPFNRIVQPDERMRRDVTGLVASSAREGKRTYLLVNNKAEGSSPLTIEAIAERLTRL